MHHKLQGEFTPYGMHALGKQSIYILTQNVKVEVLELIAVLVADVALDDLSIRRCEVAEDDPFICYRQPWVVVWNARNGISDRILAKLFLSMKQ